MNTSCKTVLSGSLKKSSDYLYRKRSLSESRVDHPREKIYDDHLKESYELNPGVGKVSYGYGPVNLSDKGQEWIVATTFIHQTTTLMLKFSSFTCVLHF